MRRSSTCLQERVVTLDEVVSKEEGVRAIMMVWDINRDAT